MPAREELPAKVAIGRLEVQDEVNAARPLERAIDEVELAIGGEDVDDALIDLNAIDGGKERCLVIGLVHLVTVTQGQVHVIEEDDAASPGAEQAADGGFGIAPSPRVLVGGRGDDAV